MAAQADYSRSIAAGLSCGVGFAIPVVAFAATLPFEGANSIVSAAAAPFAAGALAGVGTYALATRVMERRGDEASDMSAAERRAADRAGRRLHRPERGSEGGVFSRGPLPSDVPVISRAVGSPSEEEAWSEIDALLDEDSPISCDPAKSKDIYQITLGGLSPEAAAGAYRAAAQAREAETTADFMALAGFGAEPTEELAEDALDTDAARAAAIDSLDTIFDENGTSRPLPKPIVTRAEVSQVPVAVGTRRAAASPLPAAGEPLGGEAEGEPSVPMADYSGHEGTWAEALAILADDPVDDEPTTTIYVPRHLSPTAAVTAPAAVPPSPQRAQQAAEGARATEMHIRVNDMLEEEFDRVPSQSVRRMTREYLRVIQGGTASLAPLRAEA